MPDVMVDRLIFDAVAEGWEAEITTTARQHGTVEISAEEAKAIATQARLAREKSDLEKLVARPDAYRSPIVPSPFPVRWWLPSDRLIVVN